jgi:hypothetical protein
MTTQDTEKSQFLINQEKLMESRRSQDLSIAERQKYTLTPAVQESSPAQGTYQIDTFDATNKKVETRTITPLPTPQRIQPPKPITKDELTEMIESLRSEMSEQQTRFDNKDAIDNERTDKRQELSATIDELTQRLRDAQSKLDDLNRVGSMRAQFIDFAQRAEGQITAIATGVYGFMLDKIALDRHEASYKELTPLLKESVRFAVDRLGIRFFTQGNFAALHRTPTDKISDARIEATLEKVYSATEKLEGALSK